MKYIWRKHAGADWLRIRNEELAQRFGDALVIIERPGSKRALLEIFCPTKQQAQKLVREFGGIVEKLRSDWLQHFARQAQGNPLRVGSRLVILRAPEGKSAAPKTNQARPIVIPAETAFGTGEHATTAMCLRLLERITRRFEPGWIMLDAGTGSGILAIAGSYLGAGRVLALENDPLACSTAKRNARANGVRNVEFLISDVLKQELSGKFAVITANLFSELLIEAVPLWSRHLAPGGSMILSGVLRSQESAVVGVLRRNNLTALETRRRGKWIALLAQQRQQKGS